MPCHGIGPHVSLGTAGNGIVSRKNQRPRRLSPGVSGLVAVPDILLDDPVQGWPIQLLLHLPLLLQASDHALRNVAHGLEVLALPGTGGREADVAHGGCTPDGLVGLHAMNECLPSDI